MSDISIRQDYDDFEISYGTDDWLLYTKAENVFNVTFEAIAINDAAAAVAARAQAEMARDASIASAQLASKFSQAPYNQQVEPGVFSAYHWSEVAKSYAGGNPPASSINVTPTGNLQATNAQAAFAELDQDIQAVNLIMAGKLDNAAGSVTDNNLASGLDISKFTTGTTSGARITDNTLSGSKLSGSTVQNSKLASMAAGTIKARPASGAGTPTDMTAADLKALLALVKADVGLDQVDNTSDANKPVSTAQQTAINGRVPNTRTVAGKALSADITLAKADVGLGNVDNTSDANKPVSTAQQTALNLKINDVDNRWRKLYHVKFASAVSAFIVPLTAGYDLFRYNYLFRGLEDGTVDAARFRLSFDNQATWVGADNAQSYINGYETKRVNATNVIYSAQPLSYGVFGGMGSAIPGMGEGTVFPGSTGPATSAVVNSEYSFFDNPGSGVTRIGASVQCVPRPSRATHMMVFIESGRSAILAGSVFSFEGLKS